MQTAIARAIELPRHGFDGQPPIMREPRDIPGRGKRKIEGTQNIACDWLEWLQAHGHIEQFHLDAGRQLRGDSELAQRISYSTMGEGGRSKPSLVPSNLPDVKCDAIDRYNAAKAAVAPTSWRLLELVALENTNHNVAGRKLWGHFRRGEPLKDLKFALNALARHYGMA